MNYKHLFGPVISRRLGVSLGIDLVPYKVCSLNCVYCEVGETTDLTCKRLEYVPYDEIIEELNHFISNNPKLDYVTFSGSGEPTLFNRIGELIDYIKSNYPEYKLALITNSVLLTDKSLSKELIKLDLIMPSLDAVSKETFDIINRPEESINVDEVLKSLIDFRSNFSGQIWLEIFFIEGMNDTDSELKLLADAIKLIKPDRVQLNSLDRPGVESWVKAMSQERLEYIKDYFNQYTKDDTLIEIIARAKTKVDYENFNADLLEQILGMIRRRPCTSQDLSLTLNIHINEVNKVIHSLMSKDKIESVREERGTFYRIKG